MKNPWLSLSLQEPFILQEDSKKITNLKRDQFYFDLLPEPFLGNPEAPVVLLNLNPGYDERDINYHKSQVFKELSLANLRHEKSEYPFYLLNPKLRDAPGHKWWYKHLKEPIEKFGSQGLKIAANGFFCLEYIGYHSKKYRFGENGIPSQYYNFELLRNILMKKKAIVIVMRSKKRWQAAVPELISKKVYSLNSPQSAYISNRNCPQGVFDQIIGALKGSD